MSCIALTQISLSSWRVIVGPTTVALTPTQIASSAEEMAAQGRVCSVEMTDVKSYKVKCMLGDKIITPWHICDYEEVDGVKFVELINNNFLMSVLGERFKGSNFLTLVWGIWSQFLSHAYLRGTRRRVCLASGDL